MGNFFINVMVWSFSIYGFIDFIKETWLDAVWYIVKFFKKIKKEYEKIVDKK